MSFTNPFAAVGEYSNGSTESDSPVSLSYLTGLPDPRALGDPNLTIIFKSLLRRDSVTKEKALAELNSLFESNKQSPENISDKVHLAFVQVYMKLAIDIEPRVRRLAISVLVSLYLSIGKRSTKYLKYTVGPWLAATHDPDGLVKNEAVNARTSIFPGEKSKLMVVRLHNEVLEFVREAICIETAGTLSDERYVSKDEAAFKHARLVKTVLDVLSQDLPEYLDLETYQEILASGNVFPLISSNNDFLAQSALGVTQVLAKHESFDKYEKVIWKHINKAFTSSSGAVAGDLFRVLVILTKRNPDIWSVQSLHDLAHYISTNTFSSGFWPLFYNLVMNLPESVNPHSKAFIKKVLPALVLAVSKATFDSEKSAWGCFIAISTLSNEFGQLFPALAKRLQRAMPREFMSYVATKLDELYKTEATKDTVNKSLDEIVKQHEEPQALSNLARLLALSGIRPTLLRELCLLFSLAQLPAILRNTHAEPLETQDVLDKLSADSSTENLKSALVLAIKLEKVDPQRITDAVYEREPSLIFEHARELSNRGVKVSTMDLSTPEEIDPHKLVAATNLLDNLQIVKSTIKDLVSDIVNESSLEACAELEKCVSQNAEVCKEIFFENGRFTDLMAHTSRESPLFAKLESLESLDKIQKEILLSIKERNVSSFPKIAKRACYFAETCDDDSLAALLHLNNSNWLWDHVSALACTSESLNVYKVYWPLSEKTGDIETEWFHVVSTAFYILEILTKGRVNPIDQPDLIVSLSLVDSAAKGKAYLGQDSEETSVCRLFQALSNDFLLLHWSNATDQLWRICTESTGAASFHAAQILAEGRDAYSQDKVEIHRRHLQSPTIAGALLSQLHAVRDKQLVWYDRIQGELVRKLEKEEASLEDIAMIDYVASASKLERSIDVWGPSLLLKCPWVFTRLHDHLNVEWQPSQQVLVQALQTNASTSLCALKFAQGEIVFDAFSNLDLSETPKSLELYDAYGAAMSRSKDTKLNLDTCRLQKIIQQITSSDSRLSRTALVGVLPLIVSLLDSTEDEFDPFGKIEALLKPSELSNLSGWLLLFEMIHSYDRWAWQSTNKRPIPSTYFRSYDAVMRSAVEYVGSAAPSLKGFKPRDINALDTLCGESLTLHLFYLICLNVGDIFRSWYRDQNDRSLLKSIDGVLSKHITPAIMAYFKELNSDFEPTTEYTTITTMLEASRQYKATIEVEDHIIQALFIFPDTFPSSRVSLEIEGMFGVPESKKRSWLLEAKHLADSGAAPVAMREIISRISNYMKGIDTCSICYSIAVNQKSLPNKECRQCHNKYHADCVYQWFRTSKDQQCPMCRAPM